MTCHATTSTPTSWLVGSGLLLVVLLFVAPLPSAAHNQTEQATWKTVWEMETLADRMMSPQELADYLQFTLRHQPPIRLPAEPKPRTSTWNGSVEQWRPLVATYFQPQDMNWAMRVMWCESRGNPNALHPGSLASGLFQHLQRFWTDRSARAGWPGSSVFDPEANIAVAAWLYYTGGPQHWVCK